MNESGQRAKGNVALSLAHRAMSYELAMWRNLYRWALRRPRASGPGAEAFGYAAILTPVLLAFIFVSMIDISILHLLLPWETARLIADALGLYGVIWMVGLLAMMRVHPHVISDAGLRVRHGATVDITIPWDAIATIRSRNRPVPKKRAVQFEETESGLIAQVVTLSQTNVDVILRYPTMVPLPQGSRATITELRCYADDPGVLVARARRHLAAASRPTDSAAPRRLG